MNTPNDERWAKNGTIKSNLVFKLHGYASTTPRFGPASQLLLQEEDSRTLHVVSGAYQLSHYPHRSSDAILSIVQCHPIYGIDAVA